MSVFAKILAPFTNTADYTASTEQLDVDDATTQYASDPINIRYARGEEITLFVELSAATAAARDIELGYQICDRIDGTYITPEGSGIQYKNIYDSWDVANGSLKFTPPPAQYIKMYVKGDSSSTDTNVRLYLGFYESL